MATVVDALVVTLGLNAAGFVQGQKQASAELVKTKENANQAAKEISASGKQAAEFFGRIRNEALALATVFLGGMGIKALIQNLTTTDAALGRLSRNLGIAPEKIAAWQAVVERAGGTAEAFTGTIEGLNKAQQEYLQTGKTGIGPFLQAFGLGPNDLLGDIPTLLTKIGDAASKMNRQRALSLMSQAGIDPGTANFLLQTAAARAAQLAEAERLGVAHKKDTDAAEALAAAFLKTQQAVMDVAREILTNLSPAIQSVLADVNAWLGSDDNRKWLTEEIKRAVESLKWFLGGVNDIVQAMGGWKLLAIEILGLWTLEKVMAGATGLIWLLRALALVPGSGVTAAALGTLGIYIGTRIGPASNTEELEWERKNRERQSEEDQHPIGFGLSPLEQMEFTLRWLMKPGDFKGGPRVRAPGEPAEPAVPYQPGAILGSVGATAGQYDAFRSGVAALEGARYNQMGGSSGRFAGRYQMGEAEIAETARRLFVKTPTRAEFLGDPAMQERFFEAYTAGHHQQLMASSAEYRAMSPAERLKALGYAHNQGAGGAAAWLRTGQVGRDAFGTGGDAYSKEIGRRLAGGRKFLTPDEIAGPPRGYYPAGGGFDPSLAPRAGPRTPAPGVTNTSQSDTKIGAINIHTAATDAAGIARGIGPALQRFGLVAQANSGLA